MNKKLFLSLAAAGVTLLSCSDAVVETTGYNSPIETKANLTVKAEDARNGAMLSAANGLQMTFPDRVGTPLASGAFVFEDVYVGSYNVIVSATGYATVNADVWIGAPEQADVHIAYENTFIVPMYPLMASLEGHVYYPNKEGVEVPAKDVAVQLHFTGEECVLHKRVYGAKALTGADGKYTIDSLPAIPDNTKGCSYALYALGGKTGNMPFQTAELNIGLASDEPLSYNLSSGTTNNSAGIRVISNNTSVFVVSNYTEVVADTLRDSSITFTFSDKIDRQTVNLGTISYSPEIAEVTWTDNSVTLKPASRWSGNFDVKFSGLKSITGKKLEQVSYPVIVLKPNISKDTVEAYKVDELTGIATGTLRVNNWFDIIGDTEKLQIGRQDSVADSDSDIKLSWGLVKGAENGYYIYVKYPTKSNYAKIDSVGAEDDTTATVAIDAAIENRVLKFLVQAKNSQYKSVLDDAKALVVHDNSSPVFRMDYDTNKVAPAVPDAPETNIFLKNWSLAGWLGILTADSTHKYVINFPEDMNINEKKLAADSLILSDIAYNDPLTAAALSKLYLKPSYEWTGKKQLTIYVTVKAGIAAQSALDAKFAITGLKDKFGNPFLSVFDEVNSWNAVTELHKKSIEKPGLVVRITG